MGIVSLRRLQFKPSKDRSDLCPAMAGSLREAETLPQPTIHGGILTRSLKKPGVPWYYRIAACNALQCRRTHAMTPAMPGRYFYDS